MRLATLNGVPHLLRGDTALDLVAASTGRYRSIHHLLLEWERSRPWLVEMVDTAGPRSPIDTDALQAPLRPPMTYGVGLNYWSHLQEAGRHVDRDTLLPLCFAKWPSSIAGPGEALPLPSDFVDWEVELVVVLGATLRDADPATAAAGIAGYTVGQDFSDRSVQRSGNLDAGKSFPGFAPIGPCLVTAEELPPDPHLRCWVNGELMQDFTLSDAVFTPAEVLSFLSSITTLRPGDAVFTGTGAGVGVFRSPRHFLRTGDVVRSHISGIGELRNHCIPAMATSALGDRWRRQPLRDTTA